MALPAPSFGPLASRTVGGYSIVLRFLLFQRQNFRQENIASAASLPHRLRWLELIKAEDRSHELLKDSIMDGRPEHSGHLLF